MKFSNTIKTVLKIYQKYVKIVFVLVRVINESEKKNRSVIFLFFSKKIANNVKNIFMYHIIYIAYQIGS